MKISTKGRYGVRFLMDLATHGANGNVSLKEIARRQDISEKYLWQIVDPLKKAGLIRASTGPRGGYALAQPPTTVTLQEILTVLEGNLSIVPCTDEPAQCVRSDLCASREVWKGVEIRIAAVLTSITLEDMLAQQRALNATGAPEFSI